MSIELLRGVDEIIFIEGGSSDDTFQKLETLVRTSSNPKIHLLQQTKSGKFNAVIEGAQISSYENIAIWDADLTIDHIDQNNLIAMYVNGEPQNQEKFVTANRLNPQMQDSAMRSLNKIGNKFFAFATKYVAGIDVPDALAGSKIFPKHLLFDPGVCQIALSLDPFGDLFLLSQIKRNQLKFVSVNCEYRPRSYGSTNIKRWSGGMKMMRFLSHVLSHGCNKPT